MGQNIVLTFSPWGGESQNLSQPPHCLKSSFLPHFKGQDFGSIHLPETSSRIRPSLQSHPASWELFLFYRRKNLVCTSAKKYILTLSSQTWMQISSSVWHVFGQEFLQDLKTSFLGHVIGRIGEFSDGKHSALVRHLACFSSQNWFSGHSHPPGHPKGVNPKQTSCSPQFWKQSIQSFQTLPVGSHWLLRHFLQFFTHFPWMLVRFDFPLQIHRSWKWNNENFILLSFYFENWLNNRMPIFFVYHHTCSYVFRYFRDVNIFKAL